MFSKTSPRTKTRWHATKFPTDLDPLPAPVEGELLERLDQTGLKQVSLRRLIGYFGSATNPDSMERTLFRALKEQPDGNTATFALTALVRLLTSPALSSESVPIPEGARDALVMNLFGAEGVLIIRFANALTDIHENASDEEDMLTRMARVIRKLETIELEDARRKPGKG